MNFVCTSFSVMDECSLDFCFLLVQIRNTIVYINIKYTYSNCRRNTTDNLGNYPMELLYYISKIPCSNECTKFLFDKLTCG